MALFPTSLACITGIAAAVPSHTVSNLDFEWIPEKDRKLLVKTTGIEYRRIAPEGMTASDLSFAAASKLLKELDWDPSSVQALIFVTQTPDYPIPATSMLLQDRLGLPKSCLSFDINQGCAGYVYGLATLSNFISKNIKRGLLLVGDTITHTISPKDKSAAPIFSDAGTATALEWREDAPPMAFNLETDGSGYKAIYIKEGGDRYPVKEGSLEEKEIAPGICRSPAQLAMQGLDVFNFALREVAPNIRNLLKMQEASIEEFDYFVFHQANLLLNESIRKKLGIPKDKVPYSIGKYGNTSCSTIPLTLVSELQEKLQSDKLDLILSGFGVGLSWGSAIIQTDRITCPGIIEL